MGRQVQGKETKTINGGRKEREEIWIDRKIVEGSEVEERIGKGMSGRKQRKKRGEREIGCRV